MEVDDFKRLWLGEENFIEAQTSGSTGAPKRIQLLKADMAASAQATNRFFGLGEGACFAFPLSLDYIAGKMMVVRALMTNGSVVKLPQSNSFDIDFDVDLLAIVPSQAQCLIEHPEMAKRVKRVIVGGGKLNDAVASALVEAGYDAYCTYGMTETCSHVALKRLSIGDKAFVALPGVSFSVEDDGRLVVHAPHLSQGIFYTNDVVNLINDGSFIWLGRFDNVINTGARKVFPEQLESELRPYLQNDFYIVGVEDEKWGERIEMVICGECDLRELKDVLAKNMEHWKIPKHFTLVRAFLMASNGKLRRLKPHEIEENLIISRS